MQLSKTLLALALLAGAEALPLGDVGETPSLRRRALSLSGLKFWRPEARSDVTVFNIQGHHFQPVAKPHGVYQGNGANLPRNPWDHTLVHHNGQQVAADHSGNVYKLQKVRPSSKPAKPQQHKEEWESIHSEGSSHGG